MATEKLKAQYRIYDVKDADGTTHKAILCYKCEFVSHNQSDVDELWCEKCQ